MLGLDPLRTVSHWREPAVVIAQFRTFCILALEQSSHVTLRRSRCHQAYARIGRHIHVSYFSMQWHSDVLSSPTQLGVFLESRLRVFGHNEKAQVYLEFPGMFISPSTWITWLEGSLDASSFTWDVVGSLCSQQ
jgi:hypothetical protein